MKQCDNCHTFDGGSQKIERCTYKNSNIFYSYSAFHNISTSCTSRDISCVFISFLHFMEFKYSNCKYSHPKSHQNMLEQILGIMMSGGVFWLTVSLPALEESGVKQCSWIYSNLKSLSAINWIFSCVEIYNNLVPEHPSVFFVQLYLFAKCV